MCSNEVSVVRSYQIRPLAWLAEHLQDLQLQQSRGCYKEKLACMSRLSKIRFGGDGLRFTESAGGNSFEPFPHTIKTLMPLAILSVRWTCKFTDQGSQAFARVSLLLRFMNCWALRG